MTNVIFKPPIPVEEAIIKTFPEISNNVKLNYISEFLNSNFISNLSSLMQLVRNRPLTWEKGRGWDIFLYAAIRCLRPTIIVETGVFDGVSSAIILYALRLNNKGFLVSVDFPATEVIKGSTDQMPEQTLPPGKQPGWVVPAELKNRYKLIFGDSKNILPKLFETLLEIDIFLHDSLHTEEHQLFEYNEAYPRLSYGGLLLSDDISWTPAFSNFCNKYNKSYINVCKDFGVFRK